MYLYQNKVNKNLSAPRAALVVKQVLHQGTKGTFPFPFISCLARTG